MPVVRGVLGCAEGQGGHSAEGPSLRGGAAAGALAQAAVALPGAAVCAPVVHRDGRRGARGCAHDGPAAAGGRGRGSRQPVCQRGGGQLRTVLAEQRAVAAGAAEQAGAPAPTPVLGIDETRRERARWVRTADGGWRRTDPWETEFVDLATGQGLLTQVGGRSGASVKMWLAEQTEAFRDAILFVALDPSAPYASAVYRVLPHATVVVDHFHLVQLANRAVTRVRQRVTGQQLGRRGRRTDPVWANRRMAVTRPGTALRAGVRNNAVDHDPSGQLLAAWIAKEELRALLGCAARGGQRHDIAHRLTRFYDWCARADIPEITTLAETVQTWWPEVLAFLQTGITNAGTEGTNRLVKQVLRGACGFRNKHNYRMRVRLHCTRQRASARAVPVQS
jgi:transposase